MVRNLPTVDIAISSIKPALRSSVSLHPLQPFTPVVTVKVAGKIDGTLLNIKTELWCNIPDSHSPTGAWHAIPLVHDPSKVRQERGYQERDYSVTIFPLYAGDFEMTARVILEPLKWTQDSHLYYDKEFKNVVTNLLLVQQRPGTLLHRLHEDLIFHIINMCAPSPHLDSNARTLWAGSYQANCLVNVKPPSCPRQALLPSEVALFAEIFEEGMVSLPARLTRTGSLSPFGRAQREREQERGKEIALNFIASLLAVKVFHALQGQDPAQRRADGVSDNHICRSVQRLVSSLDIFRTRQQITRFFVWFFSEQDAAFDIMRSLEGVAPLTQQQSSVVRRSSLDFQGVAKSDVLALEYLAQMVNDAVFPSSVGERERQQSPPSSTPSSSSSLSSLQQQQTHGKMFKRSNSSDDTRAAVVLEMLIEAAHKAPIDAISQRFLYRVIAGSQAAVRAAQRMLMYQLLKTFLMRSPAANIQRKVFEGICQELQIRADQGQAAQASDYGASTDRSGRPHQVDLLLKVCLEGLLPLDHDDAFSRNLSRCVFSLLLALDEEEDEAELSMASALAVAIVKRGGEACIRAFRAFLACWPRAQSEKTVRWLNVAYAMMDASPDLRVHLEDGPKNREMSVLVRNVVSCVASPHAKVAMTAILFCKRLHPNVLTLYQGQVLQISTALESTMAGHWQEDIRKLASQTLVTFSGTRRSRYHQIFGQSSSSFAGISRPRARVGF